MLYEVITDLGIIGSSHKLVFNGDYYAGIGGGIRLRNENRITSYNVCYTKLLRNNPSGIETLHPRLGWQIQSDLRNVHQVSFQILVASTPEKLNETEADLWNSGKLDREQSQLIQYAGNRLNSSDDCYWKVKVWTNKGESQWSEPAIWSMGLMYYKDWRARWIGFDT